MFGIETENTPSQSVHEAPTLRSVTQGDGDKATHDNAASAVDLAEFMLLHRCGHSLAADAFVECGGCCTDIRVISAEQLHEAGYEGPARHVVVYDTTMGTVINGIVHNLLPYRRRVFVENGVVHRRTPGGGDDNLKVVFTLERVLYEEASIARSAGIQMASMPPQGARPTAN